MRVAAAAAAVAALALAGCGGSEHTSTSVATPPAVLALFAYDAGAALAFRNAGRVNGDYPIAVYDVSFASGGKRVEAYLALPPSGRPRPAAIFVHGAGGERSQLLAQALWLSGRGAVTLTLTAPSTAATPPSRGNPQLALRQQRDLVARDVIAVRRAVDLLQARTDVDPRRIGYLGWSAGARTGAIVAGVEPRLLALVLMSAGATPLAEYVAAAPAELRPDVTRILGPTDPLRLVRRARPGSLLLQDGKQDEVVPRSALDALAAAAPQPDVRWYPSGHALDEAAYRDQLDWLADRLDLAGLAARGARTGP